jgi:hypothetical protein
MAGFQVIMYGRFWVFTEADVERLAQELERSVTAAFDADPRLAITYASDVAITMTFANPDEKAQEPQSSG